MISVPNFAPLLAGFWFRDAASTGAADVDWLYFFILWLSVFFFFLITALTVAFVARYYARPGHAAEHTPHHNNALEAAWSIFPGFLVVAIFYWGFTGYLDLRTPPENAYEIRVVAKKWNWSFMYPNGVVDPNLHVPADQPVKLVMSSDDVLHSLYIPAFRVKMDVVPGRYSTLWFEATKPNDESYDQAIDATTTGSDENGYDLFCTEYCGQGHSAMLAKVIVHKSGTFETWLEDAAKIDPASSPVELGKDIWKYRGCAQCHSVDGAKGTGPTWKDTYGTEQATDKGEVTVDENYIRESILNPMAKIRDGYKGVMPSYQGQLKDAEIASVIWYIKSLKEGEEVAASWDEIGGVPGQEETPAEEGADGDEPADAEEPAEPADAAPADEQ
ncbi:Cytochrome c oxidase subunit 2 precursor [Botrimarina colliarenosi]|uniref:Cytochrome c oxidase subunit 2 n=1 Tax=Botrimarina colliarenosi TaxID=2528001 RepID=A0A5C6AKT0_9BACT|nr:c-type cytochrome [Botrimarina colliarenosi]TWT99868.1 Cytochrome c oxidase subunit 2 precursor [Botrimarina colliarenosi]